MRLDKKGYDLIKEFEGLSLKPYKCSAGVPTIGYGSTYYENGIKVQMSDVPITGARAEILLKNVTLSDKFTLVGKITYGVDVNIFSFVFISVYPL